MNKVFSKIKSTKLNKNLYNITLKTKFRRLTQPGLSRYTVDNLGTEHPDYAFSMLTHKSNAMELIAKVPPIEVDDHVAICYGVNDFGWGHPVEYINLDSRDVTKPNTCKYCGLRFVMKQHH